jgi:adenylate cyclase
VLPLDDHEGTRQGLVVVLDDITYERQVKGALTRYLPEDVVERMLADPTRQVLGGVCGRATVLFSDIRDFTRMTEGLGAGEMMDFLNGYFAVMVEEVLQQQGVLDKFIGDGLMAVFGVPYARPDDAARAVRAALRMKAALHAFNAARAARGQERVRAGIGINTGEVVSGNIGSLKRMDFTVLGDTVNSASRLEGLNKQYDTEILIAEGTLAEAGGAAAFAVRPVDRVVMKGKRRPVEVFEVLGGPDYAPTEAQQSFVRGVEAYRRRDFASALEHFRQGAGEDPPCRVFVDRCEHLIRYPPAPDWDGVWRATVK